MTTPVLDVSRLTVALPPGADRAYAATDVSFAVNAGEIVTLVGSNGAGKSTTLRTVSGLVTPRAGRVLLEGAAIQGLRADRVVARGVAQWPSAIVYGGMSLFANAPATRNEYAPRRVNCVMPTSPLTSTRCRLPKNFAMAVPLFPHFLRAQV